MHDRATASPESEPEGLTRPGGLRLSAPCRLYVGLVAFSLLGSAVSRATGVDALWVGRSVALLTIAAGFATVLRALGSGNRTWPLALCLGAGSEVAGLYVGLPFGTYAYTEAWWPTVPLPGGHRFPLALPFAWLMMAGAAYLTVVRLAPERAGARPSLWAVPAAGFLAALADVPMEPAMAGPLGYWRWLEPGPLPGGAPTLNALGWFAVSSVAAAVLRLGPPPARSWEPAIVLGVHVAFVVALGATLS